VEYRIKKFLILILKQNIYLKSFYNIFFLFYILYIKCIGNLNLTQGQKIWKNKIDELAKKYNVPTSVAVQWDIDFERDFGRGDGN